jgi:integrase
MLASRLLAVRTCCAPAEHTSPGTTLLIEQGANPLEIAKRMGHTDALITLRVYATSSKARSVD